MKVSIIVPIYNVEKYLARCIDSLLNQDLPKDEYEIILVNDGSTDKSGDIAKSYLNDNPHISYFEQQNQGQSVARNLGIEKAKGEYLWFVDSDDYILPNVLRNLYEKASDNDLDILFFVLKKIHENTLKEDLECIQSLPKDTVMTGRKAILGGYNPGSACACIIKRILIEKVSLKFEHNIYHEDVLFTYTIVPNATKIMFTKYIPYIYNLHSNSTDTSTDIDKVVKRIIDNAHISAELEKFAFTIPNDKSLTNQIIKHCKKINFGIVFNLFQNRLQWNMNGITNEVIGKLKTMGIYPLKTPFKSLKHYLFAKLILNHSWWYKSL